MRRHLLTDADGVEREVARDQYESVAPDGQARWNWYRGSLSGRIQIIVPPPDAAELAEAAVLAAEVAEWERSR